MSLAEMPELLTVEEARAILRISRNAAYELARRFEETGGREGLPVIRLGRSLRVPRAALERLLDPTEGLAGSTQARRSPRQVIDLRALPTRRRT